MIPKRKTSLEIKSEMLERLSHLQANRILDKTVPTDWDTIARTILDRSRLYIK